jgi:hypothetical protein
MDKQININLKLFNLQQEIGALSKDSKNPFYKSKYFDINSLINQLQPYLKKYKLLLQQPTDVDFETGIEFICTYFQCAESLQRSAMSRLKLTEADPQKKGSQITYYRRYTLASLLGLQAVDDDGNLASNKVINKPVIPVNKQTMGVNHEKFQKAVEHVTEGKPLSQITAKYDLTKDALEKLETINN